MWAKGEWRKREWGWEEKERDRRDCVGNGEEGRVKLEWGRVKEGRS